MATSPTHHDVEVDLGPLGTVTVRVGITYVESGLGRRIERIGPDSLTDLTDDPWVRISYSDKGVTVLCERPACTFTSPSGRHWWWEEEIDDLSPEGVLAAANAHRLQHLIDAEPTP